MRKNGKKKMLCTCTSKIAENVVFGLKIKARYFPDYAKMYNENFNYTSYSILFLY